MNIRSQLRIIGLNSSEITVYLFLLENSHSIPPAISRGTGIARTNCYNILKDLEQKSLVSAQLEGERKVYSANSPESLLNDLEKKKEMVRQLIPDLNALYNTHSNKPKIKFFGGLNGTKEVFRSVLESTTEIWSVSSNNDPMLVFPEFYKSFVEEVKTRGLVLKAIINNKITALAKDILKETGKNRDLIGDKDIPVDILVWDENVAFITLSDPVYATVIKNKLIAQTIKGLLSVIWGK